MAEIVLPEIACQFPFPRRPTFIHLDQAVASGSRRTFHELVGIRETPEEKYLNGEIRSLLPSLLKKVVFGPGSILTRKAIANLLLGKGDKPDLEELLSPEDCSVDSDHFLAGLYNLAGGSPTLASEICGVSQKHLARHWKRMRLKVRRKATNISPETVEEIVRRYEKGVLAGQIAQDLGIDRKSVNRYLFAYKISLVAESWKEDLTVTEVLSILDAGRAPGTPEKASRGRAGKYPLTTYQKYWDLAALVRSSSLPPREIREAYHSCKGNFEQTKQRLGIKESSDNRSSRSSPDLVQKIVSLYCTSGGNAVRAAEEIGCAPQTVRKYWKKEGLDYERYNLSPEQIGEVISLYPKHNGCLKGAARSSNYDRKTIRKYWKLNHLCPRGRPYNPRAKIRHYPFSE